MIDLRGNGPASSTLSGRVVRNTLFNLAARAASLIAPLLLTPYMLRVLGLERFGTWILVTSVVGYLALLDLGVGTALTQAVAVGEVQGSRPTLGRLLGTGLAFYGGVAIVTVLVMAGLAGPVMSLLAMPTAMQTDVRWLLAGSAVVLAIGQFLGVAEVFLNGLQLMHATSSVIVVGSILDIVGTVVALELGYGLPGLVAKDGALAVVLGLMRLALLHRLCPGLLRATRLGSAGDVQRLVSYGLRVQVTRLAELAMLHLDKLFLGRFVGVAVVGEYEVASRIVRLAKFLVLTVTSALMPVAAELYTQGRSDRLLALYYRSSKYLITVAVPTAALLIAGAPYVVEAWVGPGFARSVPLLQVLALGHLVHCLTSPGTTIAKGMGKPELETRYTVVLLALDVVLGLILIGTLGFRGALLATPLALIISSLYFGRIFHQAIAASWQHLVGRVYRLPMLVGALVLVVCWVALAAAMPIAAAGGRAQQWVALVMILGGGGLGYLVLLWWSRYPDDYDRQLLGQWRRNL